MFKKLGKTIKQVAKKITRSTSQAVHRLLASGRHGKQRANEDKSTVVPSEFKLKGTSEEGALLRSMSVKNGYIVVYKVASCESFEDLFIDLLFKESPLTNSWAMNLAELFEAQAYQVDMKSECLFLEELFTETSKPTAPAACKALIVYQSLDSFVDSQLTKAREFHANLTRYFYQQVIFKSMKKAIAVSAKDKCIELCSEYQLDESETIAPSRLSSPIGRDIQHFDDIPLYIIADENGNAIHQQSIYDIRPQFTESGEAIDYRSIEEQNEQYRQYYHELLVDN